MSINIDMIASRFKQARETLGYTLEEVSISTGVDLEKLEKIESADKFPSGDDVLILAAFYDCDFRSFVDSTLPPPVQKSEILFRRYGDAFGFEDRRAVQEFLYICHIEQSLQSLLRESYTTPKFSWHGNYYKDHGRQLAEKVRALHGYKWNEAPRDIYSDFRKLGIHIFRRRMDNENISGIYVNDPIAGHCVLINYNEDLYRQRFSVAHEVAHAIFDSDEDVVVTFEMSSSRYDPQDLMEIRANSFASHYLMPVSMLSKLPKLDRSSSVYWAQEFRVSTSALAKAMKDAGLVSDDEARMIKSIRVPKGEKIDPEAPEGLSEKQCQRRTSFMERGLSNYYVGLCFEAYDKELISAARLAEVLKVGMDELAELGVLFGRRVKHVF